MTDENAPKKSHLTEARISIVWAYNAGSNDAGAPSGAVRRRRAVLCNAVLALHITNDLYTQQIKV